MNDEKLEELEKLYEASTPENWFVADAWHETHTIDAANPDGTARILFYSAWTTGYNRYDRSDADLIVAARNALPDLIAEVRLLKRLLADVQEDGHVIPRYKEALRQVVAAHELYAPDPDVSWLEVASMMRVIASSALEDR